MAGKIIADTLEHSTAGSLTTDYVVNGSAKAYSYVNSDATIYLSISHNVSSITDNGTGDFSNNLTNSFSHASCAFNTNASGTSTACFGHNRTAGASFYRQQLYNSSGTAIDRACNSAAHGDLA